MLELEWPVILGLMTPITLIIIHRRGFDEIQLGCMCLAERIGT